MNGYMMICLKTGEKLFMQTNDNIPQKNHSTEKNKHVRKAIHFDLDTQIMKQYNLSRDYVYSSIKKYMEKNNFTHIQYSGYESNKIMSPYELTGFLTQLKSSLPWISPLVKDITVTDVPRKYRFNNLFSESKKNTIEQMNLITQFKHIPTTTLLNAFNELNTKTGKINTLKDVKDMYNNLEKYSDEEKGIVNKIVNECRRQETIEQKRQEYLGLSKNVDIEED
jgi:virulence-associated protein VapD